VTDEKPFWHWIEEAYNCMPDLKGKPVAIIDEKICYLELWTGEGKSDES